MNINKTFRYWCLLLLSWLDITEQVDAVSLKSKITNNFRNQTQSPRETPKKTKSQEKQLNNQQLLPQPEPRTI